QERDSRPAPGEPPATGGQARNGSGGPGPGCSGADGSDPGDSGPGDPGTGRSGPGGPSISAQVTITVPHTALGGGTGPPAEAGGFGILDHADTHDLIAAAARNPATRWCLTTLHPDGTAAAHACAAGPRPWGPAHGPPGQQPGPATRQGLLD